MTNWWLSLEITNTLFVLSSYPNWSPKEIFDTARLVNCALMAKIHTVEWTPAILAHLVLDISMKANWWGVLGERIKDVRSHIRVYRMHALIPDSITFFSSRTGAHATTSPIRDVAFEHARKPLEANNLDFSDTFYIFGINYPGAITLNNTLDFLGDLHTPDGRHMDLGTIDILRDRKRGVPRYNTFRRLFSLPPVPDFIALTGGNATMAQKLATLYTNDIEKVDLLVGCLAEPLLLGFGSSDTAFRGFIPMASRRLKSDRFIAGDWYEATYNKVGLEWVQNGGMKCVIGRHFPELKRVLGRSGNPFAPWTKLEESKGYMGMETNA